MKTGLVSVTFRKKSPREIAELVRKAGLDGIEWGSDVHAVSPAAAKEIKNMMDGLEIFSLGSYYRAGEGQDFERVLDIACTLDAPNIRIWAGTVDGRDADEEQWERVLKDAKKAALMARAAGKTISFEYHQGTLTSLQKNALRLIRDIGEDNVFLYWQPLDCDPEETKTDDIMETVREKKLMNLHVYQWEGGIRMPLIKGEERWKPWIRAAAPFSTAALIEFVRDDDADQFLKDAEVLKRLVKNI